MKLGERKPQLVSIRLAKQTEAHAISSLLFEWLRFGNRKGRLRQICKAIRDKEILVSIDNKTGKVIGFIHAVVHNDPISSRPLVYITAFYVRPAFRRNGIGSRMLTRTIERNIAQKIKGVEVATARRGAAELYRRFGFSQYKDDFGEIFLGLDLKKWKEE